MIVKPPRNTPLPITMTPLPITMPSYNYTSTANNCDILHAQYSPGILRVIYCVLPERKTGKLRDFDGIKTGKFQN